LTQRFGGERGCAFSRGEAGGAPRFGVGGLLHSRVAGPGAIALARHFWPPAALLTPPLATWAASPSAEFAVPAWSLAGLGFYMLHNSLQTCVTQLFASARGTGVSMFASALFLDLSIRQLAA